MSRKHFNMSEHLKNDPEIQSQLSQLPRMAYVTQASLLESHNKPCPYCTRPMDVYSVKFKPTKDHIRPKSKFGQGEKLICCWDCNRRKDKYTLVEWLKQIEFELRQHRELLEVNEHRLVMLRYLTMSGLK